MVRKVIGVIAGLAVAVAVIWAIEAVGHTLYPMPDDLDPENASALGEWIENLPLTAFLVILAGSIVGAFAGGAVSTLIARARPAPALIVGALLTVAGVANVVMIPHPLWFAVVSVLVYLPFAWVGSKAIPARPAQQSG